MERKTMGARARKAGARAARSMGEDGRARVASRAGCVLALTGALWLAACGGGGGAGEGQHVSVAIENPTSAPAYSTRSGSVLLGGSVAGAGYVTVRNLTTGQSSSGYVTYNAGAGTWMSDGVGLVAGANLIEVVADRDGSGARLATDTLTVTRPLQPASLVVNGADRAGTATFWADLDSIAGGHRLALFGDGTGRSTTGSILSDPAGPVVDVSWSYDPATPGAIRIDGCPTCSFQRIGGISDGLPDGRFYGVVQTVGGASDAASHYFGLAAGSL